MLLSLLVAQRVPSSWGSPMMRQFMMRMIHDVTANDWPDDVAAQMVNM